MGMIINPYTLQPAGGSLPANAVAQYKGENNTNDVGGAHNATSEGAGLTYAAGKVGQCFVQSGTNSKVQIPSINIGSEWTMEGYQRVTSGGSSIWGGNHNVSNRVGTLIFPGTLASNSFARADYYQNSLNRFSSSPAAFKLNNWYKHTLTQSSGGVLSWYVNNLLYQQMSLSHDYNQAIDLGGNPANSVTRAIGNIDEFTLYNVVKTPDLTPSGNLACQYNCSDELDASGNDFNAINTGGSIQYATGADGTSNGAWYMAGASNAQARTIHPMGLQSNWSMEFKIYPETGTATDGLIFQANGTYSTTPLHIFHSTANNIYVGIGGSTRVTTSNNSVPLNTYTTVKITYDGSKFRVYINGTLNATESGTHSQTWSWQTMLTSQAYFGSYFKGRLDDIKFFNAVV